MKVVIEKSTRKNLGASTNPDWGIGKTNLANLIHISDAHYIFETKIEAQ
jgi:hypothetical protein